MSASNDSEIKRLEQELENAEDQLDDARGSLNEAKDTYRWFETIRDELQEEVTASRRLRIASHG